MFLTVDMAILYRKGGVDPMHKSFVDAKADLHQVSSMFDVHEWLREAAKKMDIIFQGARPPRGGGVRAGHLEKITFFKALKKNPKKTPEKCGH